jgi:hypothetical protein
MRTLAVPALPNQSADAAAPDRGHERPSAVRLSSFRDLRANRRFIQSPGERETPMFAIQMKLKTKDLSSQMGKMRDWLDANRIEAAGFSCSGRSVRLVFRETQDARTFSEQFALRT